MTARVLKAPEVTVTDANALPPTAIREAIEEAFRQGRALGFAEGSRALDTEIRTLRTSLLRTLDDVRDQIGRTVALDAAALTALSIDLAGWFVEHELSTDEELLRSTLHGLLGRLADETGLVLELNPALVELLGDDHGLGAVTVRADATLATGDYRLSGDATVLEREWATAVEELAPELIAAIEVGRDVGD